MIEPQSINYVSTNETDNVKLEYKYDLLDKKYAKKELKKRLIREGLINQKADML